MLSALSAELKFRIQSPPAKSHANHRFLSEEAYHCGRSTGTLEAISPRGLKRVGSKGFDPLENWTWGLSLIALTMADRPLKAIKRSGMRLTSARKKGGNLNKKRWAGRAGMVVFVFGITFVYPATAQV